MGLFHCTTEVYSPGAIIGPYPQSRFNQKQQTDGHGWLESLLEQQRPTSQPCGRENAVYAADSPENAAIFLEGQYRSVQPKPEFHCYEVEADVISKAPMGLIRSLQLAKQDALKANRVVLEYWEPKTKWRYWEYFGPAMTVVREVKWPSDGSAARVAYAADRELASQLGL